MAKNVEADTIKMQLGIFQSTGGITIQQRFDKLDHALATSRSHPDLIVCPELFVPGYNVGDRLIDRAEPPDGPLSRQVSRLARHYRTAIVYGYPEKNGQSIHNSAAFVSANGELLANHRKQLNSPGSFEEHYFTPGNNMTLLNYQGFRVAILICYEVEFPEAVRQVVLAGAQVVLVPTALVKQWDVVASQVVPTRAFENGIWLAYANHTGHENGFDYLGGSKIVAPDGVIEADAGTSESLISATITRERVAAAQQRLPYLRDFNKYLGEAT